MSSIVKFTTIGDLLKGSPFDPSFHLGGTLTEEIFYREFYVEPPSMQSFSEKLRDTLDNAFLTHVVTFITGYAGNGKTTFLKTFIRNQPRFEHMYYAAVDWQKGDPGRNHAIDHVMSMMRRNLTASVGIGKTLAFVHANRDTLLREDFLSPSFHRFLGEYSESEAEQPSFVEQCTKEFDLEDTFAVLFMYLFERAVPGKKTVVYFDNLDVAPVEYIVSEFWERFQYAITTAERLATDKLFEGRIDFRNDFRFVFCLRDTNEAVLNAHVADRLDPKHLSYSVPFDTDFYAKVVERRLQYLETRHPEKDLVGPRAGTYVPAASGARDMMALTMSRVLRVYGVGGIMPSPFDDTPKNLLTTFTTRTTRSMGPRQRGSSLSRGAAASGAATERKKTNTREEATDERKRMAVALL